MFFGRVRVFTILLSLLLAIWNFFGVSGLVLAQSLLSDRVWLEQKINVFIEKDLTEQNRYARFSGMMHAPLILNQPITCLLYTSPSPRDGLLSRMPSSA